MWQVVGACLIYYAPRLSSLKALKVSNDEDEIYYSGDIVNAVPEGKVLALRHSFEWKANMRVRDSI